MKHLYGIEIKGFFNSPPVPPVEGEFLVVGESPTHEFVGHEGELAVWAVEQWNFWLPYEGFTVVEAGIKKDKDKDKAKWK